MVKIARCHRDRILPLVDELRFSLRHAPADAAWWYAEDDGDIVAFAGVSIYDAPHCAFLCLSGVLPAARGRGLQRRLIRVREAFAKRQGVHRIVSYTAHDNIHSANNLIACGYKLYEPPYLWGLKNALYFQKEIHGR